MLRIKPAKAAVCSSILALALALPWPSWAMSLQQAVDALGALQALDGHEQVLKEGGAERAVKVPYQLSGLVRLGIARDISRLKAVVGEFQEARKAKIQEMNPTGGEVKPGSVEERKMVDELTGMLKVQVGEEGLSKFTAQDLGLMPPVSNPIPSSVLANLGPIFDEGEGSGKTAGK